MASDLTHGIPVARLVLTWSRRMWHVSSNDGWTLCQARISAYRRADGPISTDVCRRCRRAYEKESTDGR